MISLPAFVLHKLFDQIFWEVVKLEEFDENEASAI